MKILLVGGTGIISTAVTRLAFELGHQVTLLNRGRSADAPVGAEVIVADLREERAAEAALGGRRWDAVVDFIAFSPEDVERDLRLFTGRCGRHVLISSASAYRRGPRGGYRVDESTPLENPHWDYSRAKIACEERLLRAFRDDGFPGLIVRPSLTYGDTLVPLPINSWHRSYTVVDRMRRGLPVIVPGDGSSLWTCTHNTDFAAGLLGLLSHAEADGHAFHITSDEVLSWEQFYRLTAEAAGVAEPRLIHIASDFIAACLPGEAGGLHGDKSASVVMDNTKIKRFVPGYAAKVSYREGIARTLAWFDAEASRRRIDAEANAAWDKLIEHYERGLAAARAAFGQG